MNEGRIFPVDLREKRRAARLTQQEMATRLVVTRVHYSRIETGAANISFPSALACAELFGSLLVRCDGKLYTIMRGGEIRPVGGGDDEQAATTDRSRPGLGEAALSAMQEAGDIAPAINRLAKHLRNICPSVDGPAHDALIGSAIEVLDVRDAAEEFLLAAEDRHPGVTQEAESRRRERAVALGETESAVTEATAA
ncbi:MAG: helix-turn-helix transcriptional regulator [Bacteroidota bacterium]